jgi:hypothetical protein
MLPHKVSFMVRPFSESFLRHMSSTSSGLGGSHGGLLHYQKVHNIIKQIFD